MNPLRTADLLVSVSRRFRWGSSVELCRRYSNRDELLKPLVDVLRRIEQGAQTDEPALQLDRSSPQVQALLERLSPDNVEAMSELYLAGMPAQELADRAGSSLSSVTKLLHRHGVRRS